MYPFISLAVIPFIAWILSGEKLVLPIAGMQPVLNLPFLPGFSRFFIFFADDVKVVVDGGGTYWRERWTFFFAHGSGRVYFAPGEQDDLLMLL